MLQYACKDAGVDCYFIATGDSVDEVKRTVFAHAQVVHYETLLSMMPVQREELEKIVKANTKPA